MIRCLIIDDEPQARKLLATYISEINDFEVVATLSNALVAYQLLKDESIDLVFLDINMPKLNGIEFLKTLANPPLVILTTAYSEYALEGYDLNIVDYLLKPISLKRLIISIEKAKLRLKQNYSVPISQNLSNKEFFFIKVDGKMVRILLEEVLYIEGMQNYVNFYMVTEQNYITFSKMKIMENELGHQNFLRVHKSFIINTQLIKEIKGNVIVLESRKVIKEIPIGLQFKNAVLDFIYTNGISK